MNEAARVRGQRILEADLRRSQDRGLGEGLRRVVWAPLGRRDIEGEVKADVVLVYANRLQAARRVLVHEVVHHGVGHAQEPYIQLANALVQLVNRTAHARAEKLCNALEEMLDHDA